jgi:hypothetical protein
MRKMKKTISLLSNMFLASTLFWGVPTSGADELVVKEAADLSGYCHMKFPPMREDTLSWAQPVLDETAGNVIDFYGSCDHDPTGAEEVRIQRRMLRDNYFADGD